jgi:hypothetical protein
LTRKKYRVFYPPGFRISGSTFCNPFGPSPGINGAPKIHESNERYLNRVRSKEAAVAGINIRKKAHPDPGIIAYLCWCYLYYVDLAVQSHPLPFFHPEEIG